MMNKLKSIMRWVATDGLLHFLVCYALMLTFTPIIGIWWGLGITTFAALAKEAWDYFVEKDNNKEQVLHDLICDAVGIMLSIIVLLIFSNI